MYAFLLKVNDKLIQLQPPTLRPGADAGTLRLGLTFQMYVFLLKVKDKLIQLQLPTLRPGTDPGTLRLGLTIHLKKKKKNTNFLCEAIYI